MGHRQRLTAEEYDAFSRWRKVTYWRPGELKKIKRQAGKRRREAAQQVTEQRYG